jgi:putative addiction module CopG family antidote
MRSTQQLSITLPNEMADLIFAKVASGEYAAESEVIRDGLRTLLARDCVVETWLREAVAAAAHSALRADTTCAVSAKRIRYGLSKAHQELLAKKR